MANSHIFPSKQDSDQHFRSNHNSSLKGATRAASSFAALYCANDLSSRSTRSTNQFPILEEQPNFFSLSRTSKLCVHVHIPEEAHSSRSSARRAYYLTLTRAPASEGPECAARATITLVQLSPCGPCARAYLVDACSERARKRK